jgi:hypothetical protein
VKLQKHGSKHSSCSIVILRSNKSYIHFFHISSPQLLT